MSLKHGIGQYTRVCPAGPMAGRGPGQWEVPVRYVAFLRGINLGRRRVRMEDLRRHFEEAEFSQVSTVVASGNVLFSTRSGRADALERRIEALLKRCLGYNVDTYVRTAAEVADIAVRAPFPPEDVAAAYGVYVLFLHDALGATLARRLEACRTPVDLFRVDGREIHWLCRVRQSDSDIWNSPALKALSLPPGTMRKITTVRSIAALLGRATKYA